LHAQGHEVFYPRFLATTGNLSVLRIRPYFPGYLFVKADLERIGLSTFQWMPFATGLIAFDGKPAHVPEALILAIEKRLQRANAAVGELLASINHHNQGGEMDVPFSEYEAIFNTRISGSERNKVLLQLLNDINLPSGQAVD
jgi:transcriptional antiterminator RfaH